MDNIFSRGDGVPRAELLDLNRMENPRFPNDETDDSVSVLQESATEVS